MPAQRLRGDTVSDNPLNGEARAPWWRRRVTLIVVTLCVLVGAGAIVILPLLAKPVEPVHSTKPEGASAKVVRQDLTTTSNLDGTLGYGTPIPLTIGTAGTITWLPPVGQALDTGTLLLRVNERPVMVFLGSTPLYRPLDTPGLRGADVAMVADNLIKLGVLKLADPTKAVTGDRLSTALRAWQKAVGLEQTGSIAPGDVQVLAGPSRVAAVTAQVGDAAGKSLSITGLVKSVTVDVPATRAGTLTPDAPATVVLPDGTEVAGRIASVADVVSQSDETTEPTMRISVALDDAAATGDIISSPVTVRVAAATRQQVLVVPIAALLALREGGYALQTASGHLLAVTTGLFAGDLVEVSGNGVDEGLTVMTAS